ncbi:MAG: hypothetical protein ACUVWN_04100 [bacterium]
MKNKEIFKLLYYLIFGLISASAYSAFENMELGAHSLGMGSAFVSVAEGADALFWNPAGISGIQKQELAISYMELYNLVSYSAVSYAKKINGIPFGIGLSSSSDIDGIYQEAEFIILSAMNISDQLSLGSGLKYQYASVNFENVKLGNGKGLSIDAGCKYNMFGDLLCLGIAFHNLLGYISYDRKAYSDIPELSYWERPSFSYKIGVNIKLNNLLEKFWDYKVYYIPKSILALDLSDNNINMGLECGFSIINIRCGIRTGNALTRSLTSGFGINLSSFGVDYAYVASGVGNQVSQFSFSVRW